MLSGKPIKNEHEEATESNPCPYQSSGLERGKDRQSFWFQYSLFTLLGTQIQGLVEQLLSVTAARNFCFVYIYICITNFTFFPYMNL